MNQKIKYQFRQVKPTPSSCYCKHCKRRPPDSNFSNSSKKHQFLNRSLNARVVEEPAIGQQSAGRTSNALGVESRTIKSRTAERNSNQPETTFLPKETTPTIPITPTGETTNRDLNKTNGAATTVAKQAMCNINVSSLAMIPMP